MARPKEFERTKAVDQALQVFWAKGYAATSVDDLLTAMDINRGSMYNTFRDKHTLYLEALNHYQSLEERRGAAILDEVTPAYTLLERFFAVLIEDIVKDPQRRGCFIVNTAIELAPHDPVIAARIYTIMDQMEALFTAILQHGQSDGSISARVNTRQMARLLNNTTQGLRVLGKINPNRAMLNDVVSAVLTALV